MLNEIEIKEIIEQYGNGKTQSEIAKKFNCSQTGISAILNRSGIKTRVGKNIKYTDINNQFFKEINSQECAYFLGLLYADGCVQQNTITLKLKSNDQMIIEKFRDIMSPSSPIKISYGKYSYFRINQKEICNQLITLGCIPNKSLILQFPKCVPNNLIHHFVRGYSDGDGTIYKNFIKDKKYCNFIWKITSTKTFCDSLSEILIKELNINCSKSISTPKTNQITTTLSVGGNNQVMKILDWMYNDATVYLPRKYDKYIEFRNYKAVNSIKN